MGSADGLGVVGSSVGAQVCMAGKASQHSVPRYALDVVMAQVVPVTDPDRAWTSVGTSLQRLLEASLNVSVSSTSYSTDGCGWVEQDAEGEPRWA